MNAAPIFKGFTHSHLEWAFGVRFTSEGPAVPYFAVNGEKYREKRFTAEGRPLRWLGEGNRRQIPYGLETLCYGGTTAFLTEGESDAWALRVSLPRTPVLGIPGASSWKPEWARLLERFPVIYLSFDGDDAGNGLVNAVWPFLPWARRVKLPPGRDTRDVIQLYGGEETYERLLDDADYIAGALRRILARKNSLRAA